LYLTARDAFAFSNPLWMANCNVGLGTSLRANEVARLRIMGPSLPEWIRRPGYSMNTQSRKTLTDRLRHYGRKRQTMKTETRMKESRVSLTVLTIIVFAIGTLSVLAQETAATRTAQYTPGQEAPFPRSYQLPSGKALLYAPQLASWDDQKHAVMWAGVSYQATGAKQPVMGVIKAEADTQVALEQRLVNLTPVKLTQINFASLSREDSQKLSTELQQSISSGDRTMSLDRVLAALDKSSIIARSTDSNGLNSYPPRIFFSSSPAILINIDGEPIFSPIKDTDLKFVVNTNWDLFEHVPTKTYYLRNNATWLRASDIKGAWSPTSTLPTSFSKLPDDENWKDVKAALPGKVLGRTVMPAVYVSYEPAEMIATEGPPAYVPVKGTSLTWVSNTESDVFRYGQTGPFYYLVAGRWFSAPDLKGPWTFVTPNLPTDFQKIPVEHPRSRVLASVPGTDQAVEAVLLASVPQTARVNRKELKSPEVIYQGPSDFKPIENTMLLRAVNTDKDVIKYKDSYYLCYQGLWFQGATDVGPWFVAESVPDEIYKIPPNSPSYHVTFVKEVQDEDDNDDWETYAAGAGYVGMMVGWGCAVWGSGWYYPAYYWYGGYYPWYSWYPRTYGFSAWYNPYTGTYGRGAAVYGPYGGAGAFAAYNPRTGTYARGASVYGPYGGSRSYAQAWNPRTGTYAQTRQGNNVYGNWGSSYVQRGDDWARTAHVTNRVTGNRTSGIKTSEGGGMITRKTDNGRTTFGRTGSGDIYAGHDGNVYRKQDGQWQKWENGSWNSAAKPEHRSKIDPSTFKQLDRDSINRSEANRRTRDVGNYDLNRGGRNSAGSYRGSGSFGGSRGGFRGGGRRR
jgi:hypothetical protein